MALKFRVEIAKIVGVNGAIMLEFMTTKTTGNRSFSVTAEEIFSHTTLTAGQQRRARRSLVDKKMISEESVGMPARIKFKILIDPQTFSGGQTSLFDIENKQKPLTRFDVMTNGIFDGRSVADNSNDTRLLEFIVEEWCKAWGKKPPAKLVSGERKKHWVSAMKSGITPSMFLKAVFGMKHDDWAGRRDRRGFQYVVRHVDRWLDLYDGFGVCEKPLIETRKVNGVSVPVDYEWDSSDDHLKKSGNRFDPHSQRWVQKGHKDYANLKRFNDEDENAGRRRHNRARRPPGRAEIERHQ